MAAFWASVISALILGPLVVLVQSLRKENTEQHAESRELLKEVIKTVDKVDTKLEKHIDWHLEKEVK